MSYNSKHTNIQKKRKSLSEQLDELLVNEAEFLKVIDHRQKFYEDSQKAKDFIKYYCRASSDEQQAISRQICRQCESFSHTNMEGFYNFFGMCECRWQRDVIRDFYGGYRGNIHYFIEDQRNEAADKALPKLEAVQARMAIVREKIANDARIREQVLAEKARVMGKALTLSNDKSVQDWRLRERQIQVEKNKKKIDTAKNITMPPDRKNYNSGGYGTAKKHRFA